MLHITAFFTALFLTCGANAKQIALSFDDAPMRSSYLYSGTERTAKIIRTLKSHNVQAVFFATTQNLGIDDGYKRMLAYANAGHIIANHTHSHTDLNSSPASQFVADIELAHKKLESFSTFKKWFRFPYLREGDDFQKRDQLRSFLKSSGYINGYVTVDNYDYFINKLVMDAFYAQKKVNLEKACQMLTDILIDGANYYDQVAQDHIGKVRHVLLMHENDLAARCLGTLIETLRSSGWEIVSPIEAYEDPLLQEEPKTLYLGQGRVAAIAHVRTGKKYVTKWESTLALTEEFEKRGVVRLE